MADLRSPSEIVADLHAQIAAKSPEHAALVAAFETLPRRPERLFCEPRPLARPGSVRYRRLSAYAGHRLSGASEKDAARQACISPDSRPQYEADFLGVIGGAL